MDRFETQRQRKSLAILLLAAGASSRMRGGDKLLEEIDGVALLRRQAISALSLGHPVFITLPNDKPKRAQALDGLDVRRVEVTDAAEGMSASIRAGVNALPSAVAGVVLLPADMPEITAQDLSQVIAAFDGSKIVQASSASGSPGHPVLFPAAYLPQLRALRGDTGARTVMAGAEVHRIVLPGARALTDLDTPEDWAAWRARQAKR